MNKVAVIGIVGNSVFLPVDHFHVGGETVEAKDVYFELGGKGFNQAVAAARFGSTVSFLGAVGKEDFEKIEKFIIKENIKCFLVKKDTPTAFASIITDKKGTNHVTVYQGAQLNEEDVNLFEEEIRNADILLLNNEVCDVVNKKACQIANKFGVKIILNPAPYRTLDKYIRDSVYLFTPNEFEANDLDNYNNVIQTLGEKGCLIKNENKIVPSIKVKAVDTTGAGDTFSGVLSWGLASGKTIDESVEYAVKASGKSVTNKGAVSSIPYFFEK